MDTKHLTIYFIDTAIGTSGRVKPKRSHANQETWSHHCSYSNNSMGCRFLELQ